MPRLDRSPTFARAFAAGIAALFLAIRLIGGAGYMPMVDQGRLAIMLCPDGEWTAPRSAMAGMSHMAGMHGHHQQPAKHHDPCPYAASAAPLTGAATPFQMQVAVAAPEPGVTTPPSAFIASARVQRPFATGPPIDA
jgi:hypothetical protein